MHLQESTLFDVDLQVKVTLNVAQCPLHHVTYAPTEFEVTTVQVSQCYYQMRPSELIHDEIAMVT